MIAQQSLQPKLSHRRYASVSYALQNSTVFKPAQNWVSVSDGSRIVNGSKFHYVGPETAKHLWPYLVVLERGTARYTVQQKRGDHDWLTETLLNTIQRGCSLMLCHIRLILMTDTTTTTVQRPFRLPWFTDNLSKQFNPVIGSTTQCAVHRAWQQTSTIVHAECWTLWNQSRQLVRLHHHHHSFITSPQADVLDYCNTHTTCVWHYQVSMQHWQTSGWRSADVSATSNLTELWGRSVQLARPSSPITTKLSFNSCSSEHTDTDTRNMDGNRSDPWHEPVTECSEWMHIVRSSKQCLIAWYTAPEILDHNMYATCKVINNHHHHDNDRRWWQQLLLPPFYSFYGWESTLAWRVSVLVKNWSILSEPSCTACIIGGTVAQWVECWTCDQQIVGSNPTRGQKLRNNLGQVVHTYVPLSPNSKIWYQPRGGDALRLGR